MKRGRNFTKIISRYIVASGYEKVPGFFMFNRISGDVVIMQNTRKISRFVKITFDILRTPNKLFHITI